jgi:hypothetical protein
MKRDAAHEFALWIRAQMMKFHLGHILFITVCYCKLLQNDMIIIIITIIIIIVTRVCFTGHVTSNRYRQYCHETG